MKTGFPIIHLTGLAHVGTMDISKKNRGNLDGSGLPITTEPEAWRIIADLKGDSKFRLIKNNNEFLDYYALSNEQKEEIISWGIKEGFIENNIIYRFDFYNDTMDSEVCVYGTDKNKLFTEAQVYGIENISELKTLNGFTSTSKMDTRVMSHGTTVMDIQLLSTIYVEDVLKIDGVWWDDEIDICNNYAPRGVIFNSKIQEWIVSRCEINIRPCGKEQKELLHELYEKKIFHSIIKGNISNLFGLLYSVEYKNEIKAFAVMDNITEEIIQLLKDDFHEEIESGAITNCYFSDFDKLKDMCFVQVIESIEDGNNYSTNLIEVLKEQYDYIMLIPSKDSENYWIKQGFKKVLKQYWLWEKNDK